MFVMTLKVLLLVVVLAPSHTHSVHPEPFIRHKVRNIDLLSHEIVTSAK